MTKYLRKRDIELQKELGINSSKEPGEEFQIDQVIQDALDERR